MTLVVTHANGFLGCFTKQPDGSMRQRALIDTGEAPPTPEQLATVADALDGQWGWTAPALPAAKKGKPKALPPAPKDRTPRRGNPYGGGHPSDPRPAERPALVLASLEKRPYQSLGEILDSLGLPPDVGRVSRWHHVMNRMLQERLVDRRGRNGGRIWEYWTVA